MIGRLVRSLVVVAESMSLLAASCTGTTVLDDHPPLGADHGPVTQLRLVPIPEGNPAPVFRRGVLTGDVRVQPLKLVWNYVPKTFPAPMQQPANCDFGGNLLVTFVDGFDIVYGPCKRPASINRLWAGMIYVLEDGACAPKCGPGGTQGP